MLWEARQILQRTFVLVVDKLYAVNTFIRRWFLSAWNIWQASSFEYLCREWNIWKPDLSCKDPIMMGCTLKSYASFCTQQHSDKTRYLHQKRAFENEKIQIICRLAASCNLKVWKKRPPKIGNIKDSKRSKKYVKLSTLKLTTKRCKIINGTHTSLERTCDFADNDLSKTT